MVPQENPITSINRIFRRCRISDTAAATSRWRAGPGKTATRRHRCIHHAAFDRRTIPPDIDGIDKAAAARELLHQRVAGKGKIEQRRSEGRAVHQQHRRMDRGTDRGHLPQRQRGLAIVRRDPQQSFYRHGLTAVASV